MEKPQKIPCKHMFSNGTEYAYFLETQCYDCKRFRNGKCRIYNRIEDARFLGEKVFPFDDLMDWNGYAGKTCKSRTTEPLPRKPRSVRKVAGQIGMEEM